MFSLVLTVMSLPFLGTKVNNFMSICDYVKGLNKIFLAKRVFLFACVCAFKCHSRETVPFQSDTGTQ